MPKVLFPSQEFPAGIQTPVVGGKPGLENWIKEHKPQEWIQDFKIFIRGYPNLKVWKCDKCGWGKGKLSPNVNLNQPLVGHLLLKTSFKKIVFSRHWGLPSIQQYFTFVMIQVDPALSEHVQIEIGLYPKYSKNTCISIPAVPFCRFFF